jgi:hypothetical protein
MAMRKETKFCELEVAVLDGTRIRGRYHAATTTSSSVRPSDMLRDHPGEFLLLSTATIREGDQERQADAVLIRTDSIAYLELPTRDWSSA